MSSTSTDSESAPRERKVTRKQRRKLEFQALQQSHIATDSLTTSLATLTLPALQTMPYRLLVASIGNPVPYVNTFHSAGHIVLLAILAAHPTPFPYKTYFSPTNMNGSGPPVCKEFVKHRQHLRHDHVYQPRLVVLHDELELPLGQIKVISGERSARGHNGLKSIKKTIGDLEWWRIGVGIGRPASREPDDVANYVLKGLTPGEKAKIEGAAGRVMVELEKLARG